jgi:putative ATPase
VAGPTLFDDGGVGDASPSSTSSSSSGPLADRMRPQTLDQVIGQVALVGERGFLRRAVTEDRVPSMILWGPPGSGKTTLAGIVAAESRSRFIQFSAVTSGIKEVKQVMADAARLRQAQGRPTLLFVDEIHRFNRAQQDAFLPYVERGDIVLLGATTENPSFELNAAVLSRCRVVVLEPLAVEDLSELLARALADEEHGLGTSGVTLDGEALASVAQLASGDARKALNLLELVVSDAQGREVSTIDGEAIGEIAQRKVLLYDKSGEEHFNLISALHKSMRESDPDAALYWLARMLAGGEDPLYVARRCVRFASEDVGLADPDALPQALAAWDSFHRLGSPEGELAIAQVVVYLALAPKSTALYAGWGKVRRTVEQRAAEPVPMALRNAPTTLMKEVGYGKGYVYAPAEEEGVGGIECLPDGLVGERFYEPRGEGHEAALKSRLEEFRDLRARVAADRERND